MALTQEQKNAAQLLKVQARNREHERKLQAKAKDVAPVGDETEPSWRRDARTLNVAKAKEHEKAAAKARAAGNEALAKKFDKDAANYRAHAKDVAPSPRVRHPFQQDPAKRDGVCLCGRGVVDAVHQGVAKDVAPVGDENLSRVPESLYERFKKVPPAVAQKRMVELKQKGVPFLDAVRQVIEEQGGKVKDLQPVGDAGPWSPFGDPDVPPALLKAYSDAFDKAWAERNSSKKAALQQAAEKAFEGCRRAAAMKRAGEVNAAIAAKAKDVEPVGDAFCNNCNEKTTTHTPAQLAQCKRDLKNPENRLRDHDARSTS